MCKQRNPHRRGQLRCCFQEFFFFLFETRRVSRFSARRLLHRSRRGRSFRADADGDVVCAANCVVSVRGCEWLTFESRDRPDGGKMAAAVFVNVVPGPRGLPLFFPVLFLVYLLSCFLFQS